MDIKVRYGPPRVKPASAPTPVHPSPRPILDLPLSSVLRGHIAVPLGHVLNVWTVGQFLNGWRNPHRQPRIAAMFDSPEQARQAVATCAGWLGGRVVPIMPHGYAATHPWWAGDAADAAKPQAA